MLQQPTAKTSQPISQRRYVTVANRAALSTERRLLDRLTGLRDPESGWYAVRMVLSRVRTVDLQPAVMRLVTDPLRELASRHNVEIFELVNRDVVCLCRRTPVVEMEAAVEEVRSLLQADAFAGRKQRSRNGHFVAWFDLSDSEERAALHRYLVEREAAVAAALPALDALTRPVRSTGTADLEDINRHLESIQIRDLVRQQMALEVIPGGAARPVFHETYVSIAALQESLQAEVHPATNPWLFRYLTELLDRHLLRVVEVDGLALQGTPISLNINVSTVMSRDFERFAALHGGGCQIHFEIQFIDALADTAMFVRARDLLRAHGFGVAIDGVDALALPYVNLTGLDPDLVKIWWNARMTVTARDKWDKAVQKSVARLGAARVLLARVDSRNGLEWGTRLGIRRFQGRFIDDVLSTEERLIELRSGKQVRL